jgi:hypothetical protein
MVENSCPIGYHILALLIFVVGAVSAWLLWRGLTTGEFRGRRRIAVASRGQQPFEYWTMVLIFAAGILYIGWRLSLHRYVCA